MSIIHRSHGGAHERDPGDHAGPAPVDCVLGGFEERLLAELEVAREQQATATHLQDWRRAMRPRPARPLLLTNAAPAAPAAGPVRHRRRAGLLVGGLALTAAGVAATIVSASALVGAIAARQPVRQPPRQILLAAATTAATKYARNGIWWYIHTTSVSRAGNTSEQVWTLPVGQVMARGTSPHHELPQKRGKGPSQFSLAGYDWMFTQRPASLVLSPPGGKNRPVTWTTFEVIGGPSFAITSGQRAALVHGAGYVTYRQLQELPASPAALKAWLLAYQRNFTAQTGVPEPEPATLIQSLAELVAGAPAGPRVRAAAFRVLAALPNVTNLGPEHGGQALRISLSGSQHAMLVVDPSTSQTRETITVSTGAHVISSVSVNARWVDRLPFP